MATYTTTATVAGILPDAYGKLIVTAVQSASVASQVAATVPTNSTVFHVPILAADAAAAWVVEGAEINPTDATFAEAVVTPAKLAGLSIISRELAEDSSPAAAQLVGQSIARDLARKLDLAFFGNLPTPAPAGLEAVPGVTAVTAGTAYTTLDPFAEAISLAEQEGATLGGFVANPADALTLATLKEQTGSNKPLLGPDPSAPTRRTLLGVGLYSSPAVTPGTVWALPRDRVLIVLRTDAKVETSTDAYFSSDRVGVKATLRAGFAYPHPAAIVKIAVTA